MTTATEKKLPELLESLGISLSSEFLGRGEREGWDHDTDNWKVTLSFGRRRLTTEFHMGTGHDGKAPDMAEVINSLCTDADCVDDGSGFTTFEDFCSNLGYDTDSRNAERSYKACKRILPRLQRFLGDSWEEVITASREY